MQVEWNEVGQALLVWCVLWWWLGQSTTDHHPGLLVWHWVGLVCQPSQWLLTVWMQHPVPHPGSVLLLTNAICRTEWLCLGQSLLLLSGQIYHLKPCLLLFGAYHTWSGGGVTLSSSVEVICISKQYQVSGWSGVGFLAGDWDGECDGVLPIASGLSGPFQLLGGMRVWPSAWILIPGFWSSRALIWWPLTWKQWLWIETPDKFIQFGCKGPCKKIKKLQGLH